MDFFLKMFYVNIFYINFCEYVKKHSDIFSNSLIFRRFPYIFERIENLNTILI